MITTIQCLSPWCTSTMVTYGLDKDSLAPYTEIKVDPLVENNIDNELMTRRSMMTTLMISIKT